MVLVGGDAKAFARAREGHKQPPCILLDLCFGPTARARVVAVDGAVDYHRVELQAFGFVDGGDDELFFERVAAEVGLLQGAEVVGVSFELLVQGGVEVGAYQVAAQVVDEVFPLFDGFYVFCGQPFGVGCLHGFDKSGLVLRFEVCLGIAFAEFGYFF